MTRRLGDLTWVEVDAAPQPLLLVPVGSCEQHGPHLPLDTDTVIAVAVAGAVADAVSEVSSNAGWPVLVAPPISIGASGEHDGFAGTLSIGANVLEDLAVELCRSADRFAAVVFVNGHGGNSAALRRAVERTVADGRSASLFVCGVPDGDAHAGFTETSLMLHLAPGRVALEVAASGETRPWSEIAEQVRAMGVGSVSPTGVLGDPTGASAEVGAALFAEIVTRAVARIARLLRTPS